MKIAGLDEARAALGADIAEAEKRKGATLNATGAYCRRVSALKQMHMAMRALEAAASHVERLPDLVPLPAEKPAKPAPKAKGTRR